MEDMRTEKRKRNWKDFHPGHFYYIAKQQCMQYDS